MVSVKGIPAIAQNRPERGKMQWNSVEIGLMASMPAGGGKCGRVRHFRGRKVGCNDRD